MARFDSHTFRRIACLICAIMATFGGVTVARPSLAQVTAVRPDTERTAIALQIVQNLRLYNVLLFAAKAGLTNNASFMTLPQTDRDRVYALVNAEMNLRRATIESKLANASAANYSADQLKDVLTVARLKYMQDLLMSGVNSNLPRPEETAMTAADKATFDTYSQKPHVIDFLEKLQFGPVSDDLGDAVSTAYQRYSDEAAKEKQ